MMIYQEVKPHPRLREWVKCYWRLEKDYTSAAPIEPILPDGCIDLVIQQRGGLSAGEWGILSAGFLIGPLSQALDLQGVGNVVTFGIRFYPFGLRPFLSMPIRDLTGQIVELNAIWGEDADLLVEHFSEEYPAQPFALLEQFLFRQFSDRALPDVTLVKAASNTLYQQKDDPVLVAHLAQSLYLSERSLERKFQHVTGLSPKGLARIFRFNQLRNDLTLNPKQKLTTLASRYLYFDQAHFIHDFRHFTGQTPLRFLDAVRRGQIRFYK